MNIEATVGCEPFAESRTIIYGKARSGGPSHFAPELPLPAPLGRRGSRGRTGGQRRVADLAVEAPYACSLSAMFLMTTSIVFASSSAGLNSTISAPAYITGVCPGGA